MAAPDDSAVVRLRGQVFDAYTEEPLPMAALWLKRLAVGTHTDEQGYFSFAVTADQLIAFPADTLQITAPAFRLQLQPIVFGQQPADSLLRVVLTRDSALMAHNPVVVGRVRRGRFVPEPPAQTAVAQATRRGFWQRLFGR